MVLCTRGLEGSYNFIVILNVTDEQSIESLECMYPYVPSFLFFVHLSVYSFVYFSYRPYSKMAISLNYAYQSKEFHHVK